MFHYLTDRCTNALLTYQVNQNWDREELAADEVLRTLTDKHGPLCLGTIFQCGQEALESHSDHSSKRYLPS